MSPIEVKVRRISPEISAVQIVGEIDAATAPMMEMVIGSAMGDDCKHIVCDLTEVTHLGVAGLSVLVRTARELRRRDGSLCLAGSRDPVKRLLDLARLSPFLPTYSDVDRAVWSIELDALFRDPQLRITV